MEEATFNTPISLQGLTLDERLKVTGLFKAYHIAVSIRDGRRLKEILSSLELDDDAVELILWKSGVSLSEIG